MHIQEAQFGKRISAIQASKQKLLVFTALCVTIKLIAKKSIQERLISRAKRSTVFSSQHWCLSSLPQQKSFQSALVSVQPSSAEELPVSIGVCPAFLSRRASNQHWCLSSLPQQKSFQSALVSVQPSSAEELPVSIGVCPAFLSRRASSQHWCLSSLPQQKSFQSALVCVPPSSAEELPETVVKAWRDASWRSCVRVSHC